jgi:hypothetical protein
MPSFSNRAGFAILAAFDVRTRAAVDGYGVIGS